MDIARKKLQDSVSVGGKSHRINTDFRIWILFEREIRNEHFTLRDFDFCYMNRATSEKIYNPDAPDDRAKGLEELMKFFRGETTLPRSDGSMSDKKLVDYRQDSGLIFAAFFQQYGIDLFETSMHWWKFKALFAGLKGTKLNDVIGWRCYESDPKNPADKEMKELQRMWELENDEKNSKKVLDEFNSEFE